MNYAQRITNLAVMGHLKSQKQLIMCFQRLKCDTETCLFCFSTHFKGLLGRWFFGGGGCYFSFLFFYFLALVYRLLTQKYWYNKRWAH